MSLSFESPTRSLSVSAFVPRELARSRIGSVYPILATLALGCASEGIDIGGGVVTQSLARGARCQASTTVEGHVHVTNQQELEELEGCEQILGDLTIYRFAGADLAPLRALRIVDAGFVLGSFVLNTLSEQESADSVFVEEIRQLDAALQGTWLASLNGLESLERVGALAIMDTAVPDLLPLARLRHIGGGLVESQTFMRTDRLSISGNVFLRDLTGLEQVRGFTHLDVDQNPALESLAGLTVSPELTYLSLMEDPALTDIDALSSVTRLGTLTLDGLGITDVDALSAVTIVDGEVTINFNPHLVDLTGLGNFGTARSISLNSNAALKRLPSLQSYQVPPDFVVVSDNPELEELTFDFSQVWTSGFFVGGEAAHLAMDGIVIGDNAKLRRVTFPRGPIEQLGVAAIQILSLERNASLTEIDFGALSAVDRLVLDQNPALAAVTLNELSTVDTLQITNNPSLDVSVFDPVRTFQRIESGNASATVP